jgi:hypothetical protein
MGSVEEIYSVHFCIRFTDLSCLWFSYNVSQILFHSRSHLVNDRITKFGAFQQCSSFHKAV